MGRDSTYADNIVRRFFQAADSFPENTAFHFFRDGWQGVNYREFRASASAAASHLIASGVSRGDRVAIISENRPEWCIAYMAVMLADAIAVPLDSQLGPSEVRVLLSDAAPRVVLHSSKTSGQVAEAVSDITPRPVLMNLDSGTFIKPDSAWVPLEPPKAGPDDIASIIYTSGTTGAPKGVVLTHSNFCSDAEALIKAHIVSHEDNVLSVLPLHHTYAFMCTFLVPVFLGASVTYPASMKGPDILSAMSENRVSVLIGVPQLLALIRNGIMSKLSAMPRPLRLVLLQALGLSGLLRERLHLNIGRVIFRSAHSAMGSGFRFFGSGGARLDPAVMRDLEAVGFTVLEGYGLTETSPVVTFNPPEKRKAGSVGRPLPGVEIRILDPDESGEGEILIRGPMVMKGYYHNPSATGAAFLYGWFRTGDVGKLDGEGYLYITGRTKEVIVLSSGKNIYPEEVEKLYSSLPLIREICVIGVQGPQGEVLRGIVVPDMEYARSTGVADLQEALKWQMNSVSSKIPSYMRLTGFTIRTDPLPRTPLGKLRRFMIAGGAAVEEKPMERPLAEPVTEAERLVMREVGRFMQQGKRPGIEDDLELDVGLDSLSKIELAVALEKALSLKLPEDFLSGVRTVGELAKKVEALAVSGSGALEGARAGWREILASPPSGRDLETASLADPTGPMAFTHLLHAAAACLFRICFRLEAKGQDNIPRDTNFIIAPNHTSFLDGFSVILSLPFPRFRTIYSLGLSQYFTGRLKGWVARIAHVIPIDAASYLSKALQMSAYVLRNGRSLCVFPEGGRSYDGSLMEFKKGVGILARELGVPVVPVYIEGAFGALPRGAVFPRFRKITVTFGRPLMADDIDFRKRPEGVDEYQYFADKLRERVKELREKQDR